MSTFHLQREIPKSGQYDIVVAGGGPAGSAAAICAARLGARVLLVEATGCLGGMGTSGLVTAFDPMADGERSLVNGFQREVVETLYERKQLGPQVTPDFWRQQYHRWTPFRAEGLKRLLDELAVDAGVEVRFFTRVIEAHVEESGKRVGGVVLHNIEGLCYVEAKAFVDCTGDAVLADLCGAPYRTNEAFMPGTLCSLHAGVDWSRFCKNQRQQEQLEKAIKDGHFSQPDRHIPGLSRVGDALGYLNAGHVFKMDALKCSDLTNAMMWGRRLVSEFVEAYKKYVTGCEKMELVTTGALLGVRETRRIEGEYELNIDDYLARRQFPDQIGVFNKFVDIHVRDCSDEEYERFQREHNETGRLGKGECFGIPYSILVPRGWENLWVAGRCNSSDVQVHGSIRVMPAAGMMGQAAGTAAVQSIRTGQPGNDLNTRTLVETLREAKAYLPQESLSEEMTRGACAVA